MKFPQLRLLNRSLASHAFVLLALMTAMTLTTVAQKSRSLAPENDSASLEQCRNLSAPAPGPQCVDAGGGVGWVSGNAGASNSHWEERQFISYRMLFGDLSAGTNVVVIGYDFIHSGKHAIDYLGTYNHTETDADPCSGVSPCSALGVDTAPVPTDTSLPGTVPQIPGVFTLWGADFDSNPTFVPCGVADESLVRCVRIAFTPDAGVTAPTLAWGGHIAWRGEWGAGQSAGGISGSPYHMRLEELNGSGGNQDRSLSANAVFGPGSLRIVKSVTTFDLGTSSTTAFFFNITANFGVTNFQLVDDDGGPGDDDALSTPVNTFDGTANVFQFTENVSMFPFGSNWSYAGTVCTEDKSTVGTGNVPNGKTVVVDPEETVVCTVSNTQLDPSAAQATISGRTVDAFGYGISGSRITVMNAATGETFSATTNPFGYYTIDGTEVGNFYIMTVSHKRYVFADNTRSFTLNENLSGMDFIANP